jgi:glycopeptide antibiotics resistance protein
MMVLFTNFFLSKRAFYAYCIILLLLIVLPLNSASELNNITILHLRGDYFFHILMFLPWMFFHNPAFGNLRSGRSFWPLAISFWSAAKTKDKSQLTANSQQLSWLLTGLLFASATEGLQYFLPWRAFNVNDLLANGLGILMGYLLAIGIKNLTRCGG